MRPNDLDLVDRHSRRELRDFLRPTRGPNATFTREWIAGHGVLPFKVADAVRRCIPSSRCGCPA